MISPREVWQFPTRHIGQRVHVFDSLESTNDHAANLAHDPAHFGEAVLAEFQSKGRGQHGREWLSRAGQSLLTSLLLKPTPELARPVILTAWVAVSVRETVRLLTGHVARIKWPNDILVEGRKLCGILIEQSRAIVVGLGLNVNQQAEEFQTANLEHATSLSALAGRTFEIRDVLACLLNHLDAWYVEVSHGELTRLEDEWRTGLGVLNRHVTIECANGQNLTGWLRGIRFDGLSLEADSQGVVTLQPEAIGHILLK